MGFKEKLIERTYKNAHTLELSYKDKKGNIKKEKVIIKKPDFIFSDWRRIYPIVDENGKINYINLFFGGWRNFLKLSILIIFLLYFYYFYLEDVKEYLNGNKYVVVSTDNFKKYCINNIEDEKTLINMIERGNVSVFKYGIG